MKMTQYAAPEMSPNHIQMRETQAGTPDANVPLRLLPFRNLALFALSFVVAICSLTNNRVSAQDGQPPAEAVALFREAAGLQNAGEFDLAADVWDSFTEKFPNLELTQKAFHYSGVCHLQNGRLEKARDSFASAISKTKEGETFAQQEDALLNLGWCQFQLAQKKGDDTDQYAQAATTFEKLLKEFANGKYSDQAQYFLGEARYLQGKVAESVNPYAAVIEQHRDSNLRPNAMYALGIAYEDLSQNSDAASIYSRFLEDYPNHELTLEIQMRSGELMMQQAQELASKGEAAKSQQTFEQAANLFDKLAQNESFGQRDHALYQRAYCLFKLDQTEQAAQAYAKVVTDFPDSDLKSDATLSAGRSFYRAEQYEPAKQWLRRSMASSGKDAVEAAHWLCRILLREGDAEQAYEVADDQLKIATESDYASSLAMDRADAANEIPERKAEAANMYLAIAKSESNPTVAAQALYFAAFASFETGEFDRAIELGKQFVTDYEADSRLADVKAVLGESYLQKRQFAEAEAAFKSIASTPNRKEQATWQLRGALAAYLQNKFTETITLLDKLPESVTAAQKAEANYLIGASQFQLDEFAAAKTSLEASLAADANWAQADETTILLARAENRLGNGDQAMQLAKQALTKFSDSSRLDEMHFRLGEMLYNEGNYDEALKEYDAVLRFDDSAFEPYAMDGKAWSLIKQQNNDAAITMFSQLIENHPDHSLAKSARYGRAVSYNQIGKHAEAETDLKQFLSATDLTETQQNDARFELSLAAIGTENDSLAIETLVDLTTNHPNFSRHEQALYELAWCYLDESKNDQATATFNALLTKYPDGVYAAESNFHLGEANYAEKDYVKAATNYEQAIASSSDKSITEKALYKLGWSQFHQDQFKTAEGSFQKQLTDFGDGPLTNDGKFMVAECQYRDNRFEEAASSYTKLWQARTGGAEFSPAYVASILLHGAQSAGQIKDWETAKNFGLKFTEAYPEAAEVPEAWLQVGRAYRGLDQKEDAIAALEKAALQSQNEVGAEARFIVGEIYFGDKEYEEAQKQFRRVMLGYGGDEATREVKSYQAMSAFEAARCSEVQIKDATGDAKAEHIADARRFYNEVVNKHSESPYAAQAKRRLEALPQ